MYLLLQIFVKKVDFLLGFIKLAGIKSIIFVLTLFKYDIIIRISPRKIIDFNKKNIVDSVKLFW